MKITKNHNLREAAKGTQREIYDNKMSILEKKKDLKLSLNYFHLKKLEKIEQI